ncbi:MAG: hypothetical protein WCJ40_10010 [Planctomycetota bacterium]
MSNKKTASHLPYRCLHCHAINVHNAKQCYLCQCRFFYWDQVATDHPDQNQVENNALSSVDEDSDQLEEPWDSPEEFEAMQNQPGSYDLEKTKPYHKMESNQKTDESPLIKGLQNLLFLAILAVCLIAIFGIRPAVVIMAIVIITILLANRNSSEESANATEQPNANPVYVNYPTSKLGSPQSRSPVESFFVQFLRAVIVLALFTFALYFSIFIALLMMCASILPA